MKKLNLLLLLGILTLCCNGQKLPVPADKKATKETIKLFQSLYELQNKGVIYGHQDDLMYGLIFFQLIFMTGVSNLEENWTRLWILSHMKLSPEKN